MFKSLNLINNVTVNKLTIPVDLKHFLPADFKHLITESQSDV